MRQPGLEGSLGENGYMYMYGWAPLLLTWNHTALLIGYTMKQNTTFFFNGICKSVVASDHCFFTLKMYTWKILRTQEPAGYRVTGSQRVRHDISSIQFSRSVVSDSLQSHGLQHARLPCPSPPPRVYSNSCALSRWCHPTISFSVIPFSSHLQSFPASGSFPMSQLFTSSGCWTWLSD